ncbi:hypothetical protein MKX01_002409, partial [Papaver californicum]
GDRVGSINGNGNHTWRLFGPIKLLKLPKKQFKSQNSLRQAIEVKTMLWRMQDFASFRWC